MTTNSWTRHPICAPPIRMASKTERKVYAMHVAIGVPPHECRSCAYWTTNSLCWCDKYGHIEDAPNIRSLGNFKDHGHVICDDFIPHEVAP